MTRSRLVAALLLASCLAWTAPLAAEEPPLAVGSEGVPVPKKVKDFRPKYPPEAAAQGIRGIVILDLVIDATGAVESVSIIRSVPGLDDAAVAAAHQWRYEPVKVAGRPARVRMTIPITFSLALPILVRDPGVPDLRQGVMPAFPEGGQGGGKATVAIILEPDGRIASKGAMEGSPEPWTHALLAALETWRFGPQPDDTVVSFRIEASFSAGKGSQPASVSLRATGLKVVDASAARTTSTSPASQVATPSAPTPPTPPTPASPAPTPATAPPPAPAPPPRGGPAAAAPVAQPRPAGALPAASVPAPQSPAPAAPPAGTSQPAPAAPPLEVVTAPLPQLPPENGVSAVRDVLLQPGVPDLARGRRPVPPPVARLAGATGIVEVAFSVSAAGTTMIQKVTGPDLLKKAADQSVASWVFRRTRADRAYLIAVFDYAQDRATASVRPQLAPPSPTPPSAAPASAPGATTPGAAAPPGAAPAATPAETARPATPAKP